MSTNGTLVGVYSGTSFAATWDNPSALDILQVINEGGKVVWNCDHAGTTNTNPVSPTKTALLMTLFGSTVVAAFEGAFQAITDLDILQIINPNGGAAVYHIDSEGTANTP